jgi:hypothetical protein
LAFPNVQWALVPAIRVFFVHAAFALCPVKAFLVRSTHKSAPLKKVKVVFGYCVDVFFFTVFVKIFLVVFFLNSQCGRTDDLQRLQFLTKPTLN